MIRRVFNLIGIGVCLFVAGLLVPGGAEVTVFAAEQYKAEPTVVGVILMLLIPWITVHGVFLLGDWVVVLLRDLLYPAD